MFRGNGGSDCASECASNDDVTGADVKRQQTPTDVTSDANHLVKHQVGPSPSAASTGRRHDYHQLQVGGYDAHCYTANDAASAAVPAGYLPGTPLSCIPPYFTSNTRASVFH